MCSTERSARAWVRDRGVRGARRRAYLDREFDPALQFLAANAAAPPAELMAQLAICDAEGVRAVRARANERLAYDPAGAVLVAQRLLEQVRRHILGPDEPGLDPSDRFFRRYRAMSNELSLGKDCPRTQVLNEIVGWNEMLFQRLGALRTGSDAPLAQREAELAIDVAGALATFLIEAWEASRTPKVNAP